MPAVSITRGLVLMILRTPPSPQDAPVARALLVQQSPTKAAMHVGRLAGVAALPEGFRHCGHRHGRQARAVSINQLEILHIGSKAMQACIMLAVTASCSQEQSHHVRAAQLHHLARTTT
jgi:hypothetical protein